MPGGNSQGITVPIQAKIEGWKEQVKQIQEALKNVKVGSDISKGLTKDLKSVETMINNLGKNMNQRLTSDSQITAFLDKLRAVDELFGSMGKDMSSIRFEDLDVEYITNNFKDLTTAIEDANKALAQGTEDAFNKAIGESDRLQKIFTKFSIDPKQFGMTELGDELRRQLSTVTTELATTNKAFEETKTKIAELKDQAASLGDITKNLANPLDVAKSIVGDTSQLGVSKELNVDFLKDLSTKLSGVLTGDDSKFSDTLKERKEEISKALSELVDAKTLDEAKAKLQAFYDLIPQNMRGLFNLKASDLNQYKDQLTQLVPDEAVIRDKMQHIRQALEQYKIDDKTLNNIMFRSEELVRAGKFDELPELIRKTLQRTKVVAESEVPKIQEEIKKLTAENGERNKYLMRLSGSKTQLSNGIKDYEKIIEERVKQEVEPLRKEVADLRAQLEKRATSNIRDLGSGMKHNADEALRQSTAAGKAYEAQLAKVKSAEQMLGKLQGVVQRWFSIYAVIRMVRKAISSMVSTIKELDKTITNIAIVTKMDQNDLWGQMPKYTAMAREYASSISGVYEVSQLYYQQGLQTADVMALTEQTLKMARVSGLGYADATNYMTNAVRSFKMEMQDAQVVVDVYSALAAKSATSVSELANAMSKTASSAQAVGSSFQNTTAMMAVMIEATRESAENIGSAMKSIISREGEAMSLNKVDTALKTVGISIKDAAGQFRNFDDVIMELSSKWDTIDKNTQRYIATIMAGNRQQSRFLALVSSYDRLKELSAEAANAEDASQLQFLKSLDSVDAKVQQLQTSIQALYVNSGLEKTYKSLLDFANQLVTTLDNISNNQGLLGVIGKIGATFTTLATLITTLFTTIKLKFSIMQSEMTANARVEEAKRSLMLVEAQAKEEGIYGEALKDYEAYQAAKTRLNQAEEDKRIAQSMKASTKGKNIGMIAAGLGMVATTYAASLDVNTDRTQKAVMTGLGGIFSGIGTGAMIGGVPGLIIGTLSAIPSVIEAVGMATETTEEKINRLKSSVEESSNATLKSKDELQTLENYKKKYDELYAKRNESNEAYSEYVKLMQEIANTYPSLITGMDSEGNYIVELTSNYDMLAKAKRAAYNKDFIQSGIDSIKAYSDNDYLLSVLGYTGSGNTDTSKLTSYWDKSTFMGLFSQAFEDYSANDWATKTYSEMFSEAMSGQAKQYNGYIGFEGLTNIKTEHGFNYSAAGTGNFFRDLLESNPQLLQTYGIDTTKLQQGGEYKFGSDLDFSKVTQIVMATIADKLDQGLQVGEINDYFQQFFGEDFLLNSDLFGDLQELKATAEYRDEYINQIVKSLNVTATKDAIDSLGLKTGALETGFLSDQIQTDWENSDLYKKVQAGELGLDAAWQTYMLEIENRVENFYNNSNVTRAFSRLSDTNASKVNNVYNNIREYSSEQLDDVLAGIDNSIVDYIKSHLEETTEIARTRFTDSMKDFDQNYNNIDYDFTGRGEFFSNVFGTDFLEKIQSNYANILSNSSLPDTQKLQQISNLDKAFTSAANLKGQNRTNAMTILTNKDLTTITGIYEAINAINDLHLGSEGKAVTDALELLATNVQVNISTEFEQFTNTIVSQFKDFDKALSNATKGMDLSAAIEMANKLGVTLNDAAFEFKNGKYYFKDIDRLKTAYVDENTELYDALDEQLQQQQGLAQQTYTQNIGPYKKEWNVLDSVVKLKNDKSFTKFDDTNARIKEIQKRFSVDEASAVQLSNWYDNYYEAYQQAIQTEGSGYDSDTTFSAYITSELTKSKENLEHAKEEYGKYQVNSILLTNGQISEFLESTGAKKTAGDFYFGGNTLSQAQEEADLYNQQLIDRISTGDIDNLPDELKEYASLIYDTYHSVRSSIANAMIASVGGNGTNKIKVTEANTKQLEDLKAKGFITGDIDAGSYVTIAAEKLSTNATEFLQYVVDSFETTGEQIKALAEYHKNQYSNSATTSLNKVIDKSVFSYEDLLTYMHNNRGMEINAENIEQLPTLMSEIGLAINSAGEVYVKEYDKWITSLEQDVTKLESNPKASTEEINAAKAKLDAARNKQTTDRNKAVKDVISNYSEITEAQQQALADSLGQDYNAVSTYFKADAASGTKRLDLAALKDAIDSGTLKVSDATKNVLINEINSIYDEAVRYMSTATSLMSQGTTSQDDMAKFSQKMQDLQKEGYLAEYKPETYFSYDTTTKSYKLNADAWKQYLDAEKKRLAALDFNTKQIQDILVKEAASNIDVQSFLKAENRGQGSLARTALKGQLQAWLTTKNGKAADDALLESYVTRIENGGEEAVKVLKELAAEQGQEVSSEEIEAAYRAKVTDLQNASTKLAEVMIGSNIGTSGKLYDILSELDMVDNNGVVKSTFDAVSAYKKIYEEMADNGEKTVADLNTAYADLIAANQQEEAAAVNMLKNGANISSHDLGTALAAGSKSLNLSDYLTETGNVKEGVSWLKSLGADQYMITDFDQYAGLKGWTPDSEVYNQAYVEWQESMKEYQRRGEKYLNSGNISGFLQVTGHKGDTALAEKIAKGETDTLPEDLKQYAAAIENNYRSVRESIANALIDAVGDGSKIITVTEQNIEELKALQGKGWITGDVAVGKNVTIAAEKLAENSDEYIQYLIDSFDSTAEQIKALGQNHANKYSKSRSAGLNKVIDKQTIAYEDLLSYMNSNHGMEINVENIKQLSTYMEAMGLAFNNAGEAYIKDYDKWIANLEWDVQQLSQNENASPQERNAAKARLTEAKTYQTRARNEAVQNMISNYTSITAEQQEALANALDKDYNSIEKYLTFDAAAGTNRLNLTALKADIDNGYLKVSEETKNALITQINSIYDEAINYISTAASLIGTGTVNQSDMQAFVEKMQSLYKEGYTAIQYTSDTSFSYDAVTKTYQLNAEAWSEYITAEKKRLAALGFETDEINGILRKQAADSIDVSSFLQATNKGSGSMARTKLQGELQTWLTTVYGQTVDQTVLDFYTSLLESGGEQAISVMKEIAADAGRELSTDEIKAAYRAQVEPIISLVESLDTLNKGSIVDKNQIEALVQAGFTVNEHGVITAVGDMAAAYESLYDQMRATAEATTVELTAELNNALGKYLDTRTNNGSEQSALEALGKAAELTYSDFLQFYTDAGIELTKEEFAALEGSGAIKSLGGNKMQIVDFGTIAAQLGWEVGGEVYEAGYSAYVDSVIAQRNSFNTDARAASQLSSLASAKVGQEVNIYDIPANVKEALGLAGQETYTVTSEAARDTMLLMMAEAIDDSTLENNPQLKSQIYALKEEILAKRNRYTGLTGIIGNNISLSDAETFATSTGFDKEMTRGIMEARGYIWDQYTQTFKASADALASAYGEIEMARDYGADDKTINELTAAADDLAYELGYGQKNNVIIDALQNYTNLSNESVAALKTAFKDEITDWSNLLTYDQTSGTSKLNVKEFITQLNTLRQTTAVVFNEAIQNEITNLTDTYLQDISTGIQFVNEGTTSQTEMLEFTRKLNEATGQTLSVGDYFKYDVNLQAFTLSADAVRRYVEAQKSTLEALGLSGEALNKYIEDQTNRLLANKIDFSSFYSATNISGTSKTTQELVKAYRDWYESKNGTQLTTEMIQSFIDTIDKGGEAAVSKIKEIKGTDASADELEAAYNAQINKLRDALVDVEKQIGDTVTGYSINILEAAGYGIQRLDDGTAVITSIGDMVAAYNLIYNRMKETSEATTADLNSAYAKALTANEQADIDAINTLGDAMGMTYESLGELLAKYGDEQFKSLEYAMAHMADLGIQKIGNGKIRIYDFATFADKMGWQQGSEEYVAALKTYNDSFIKLNRRRQKDIIEEVNSVADAKAGDKLNLTEFANYFDENVVNELLNNYGASIKDGILTLENNADIPGILSELGTLAYQAGLMIPEEMAALEDTIAELLSSMGEMISKGISGNLNNQEALSLTNWARQQGLIEADQNLTFIKTQEGLKLSTAEAIKLYQKVKEIDGLQGEIVFDSLRESLEASNDNYKSMSSIMARIKELRTLKDTADPTKREQYEAELEVAEEIARVRATSEDDSFNFMSNKIPAAQNNPLNYFSNWGKAWKTLRDSFKAKGKDKAKIDYQDFYNMITEMGNLAATSGVPIKLGADKFVKDADSAAKLIEQGAKALSVAADGSIKVDLSKFGMNFSSGSKEMAANIQAGIKEMAQSQIDMLDSMISLLEVVVAMEGLQDVDTDHDMVIEVPEIALETHSGEDGKEYITKFTDEYKTFTQSVLDLTKDNPDLKKGLDDVKVNGHTMTELLSATEDQLEQWHISAQTVSQLMTALLTLTTSDLYDTDDVWNSFMKIFSGLDLGDTTIEVNGGKHSIVLEDGGEYSINWDSAATKANIERAVKNGAGYANSAELQQVAQAAWDKLKAGETISIEENYALQLATGEITIIPPKEGEKDPKYRVGSQTYTDKNEAVRAATLVRGGASNKEADFNKGQETIKTENGQTETVNVSYGSIKIGNKEVTIFSAGDGKLYYKVNGEDTQYTSRDEAIKALFKQETGLDADATNDNGELTNAQEYEEWKVQAGIKVEPLIKMSDDTKGKITKEVQKEIRQALDSGDGAKLEEINKNYNLGIDFSPKVQNIGSLSTEELNELYSAFGIENKSVSLDASVSASGDENLVKLINDGEISTTINVTLTGEDLDLLKSVLNATITVKTENSNSKDPSTSVVNIFDKISQSIGKISDQPFKDIVTALGTIKTEKVDAIQKAQDAIKDNKVKAVGTAAENIDPANAQAAKTAINGIRSSGAEAAKAAINSIRASISSAHANANLSVRVNVSKAKGNLGALAKGNVAMAGGTKTLMGELGPELVVSNGHYFLAGQSGAEFVDLDRDAIVFNHKQTERLMSQGGIGSRGTPFTNEQNAISYAKGNVTGPAQAKPTKTNNTANVSISSYGWDGGNSKIKTFNMGTISVGPTAAKGLGPAMASASAALAALKQLRAMWQSLMNSSLKDLAGKGGGGGGGGKDAAARQAWITQVERWYNLMQKIAQCEKDITHEETLRTKINSDYHKNGKAYYESQLRSLRILQEQMVAQEELNISQRDYFNQRREQLNTANGPFTQWYTFDENGQLKYNDNYTFTTKDGQQHQGAFNFMSELMSVDEMGRPKYTAEEQYNALVAAGFKDFMQYDTSGKEIVKKADAKEEDLNSFYVASVEALWEHMDSQREEMQTLHDTIEQGENEMLELQTAQNEILQEIRENQLAVEDKILEAIVDQRQRAIDDLSNQRSALEESTASFIEGLTDALNKERNLYDINQDEEELNKLRRQLAILKRSGGSGAEINQLEDTINSKEKDSYFEKQQQEIDAIQTASDLQLERLDAQIDLMTKTLEYEKEHGRLWADVYQVMAMTPSEITSFIMKENSTYWSMSPLKTEEEMQNVLFMSEAWDAFRTSQEQQLSQIYAKTADGMTIAEAVYGADNSWNIFTTAMTNLYGQQWETMAGDYKNAFENKMAQTADITTATTSLTNTLGTLGDRLVSALSTPAPVPVEVSTGGGTGGGSSVGGSSSSGSNNSSRNNTSSHTHNRNGGSRYVGSELHDFCTCGKDMGPRAGSIAAQPSKIKVSGALSSIVQTVKDTVKKATTNAATTITKKKSTGGCFIAGTKIIMSDMTYKNIEDIVVGDTVIAYNELINSFEPRKVTKSYIHHNTPRVLDITLSNGLVLGITPGHPILTTEGWKSRDLENSIEEHGVIATWLNIGDIIIDYFGNVSIVNIQERDIPISYDTYNIEVEDCHTFLADGVVVHNMKVEYDVGGMVQEDGQAYLHAKESVLTPAQTKILRNDILGSNQNSLMSLLLDFRSAYSGLDGATYSSMNNNDSLIIENATVNMNVSQIANDYDAQRAGEQAMSKILEIARKTSAKNSIRR